ncbi:MAG TPA: P-loop NTPase fold protein, partial [Gemmatimonadaceae bacterium]|nr:P-loop NTPase fold protein [Gemmatimonadaceae bacterium]
MSDLQSNAPAQSHGSIAFTKGDGGRSSNAPWRRRIALAGIAALVVETVVALLQAPRVEPLRQPARATLDWWLHPIERNALQRMPVAPGPLYAVFALRGTDDVWFAGAGGLILRSTDGGATWDSTNVRAVPQTTAAPASPTPDAPARNAPRRAASARGRLRGEPAVRVAPASYVSRRQEKSLYAQEKAQYPNAPVQQRSPAPRGKEPMPEQTVQPDASPDLNVPPTDSLIARQRQPPDTVSRAFYPRLVAICLSPASGMGWAVGERGAAFRTTDRGATWTQLATGIEDDFAALACDDRLGAIATSSATAVWLRNDGAGTASVRGRASRIPTNVAIGAGDTIWTSGDGQPLRFSTDTARTWGADSDVRRMVAVVDATTRFAIDSAGRLAASADGGRTWTTRGGCPSDSTSASLVGSAIIPASATTALMVDAAGRVWRTADGWASCEHVLDLDGDARRLAPASEKVWYAASDGALRSDDGGRTWHSLVHTARLSSLHFRDSQHGIAGLENGLVAVTSDAGHSWSHHRLDPTHTAPPVHFAQRTATELVAFDDDERRFRSVDGGRTWQRTTTADSVTPVVFTSEQTGWGITADTTWTTRDGGTSWSPASTSGALRALTLLVADSLERLEPRRVGMLRDGRGSVAELWLATTRHEVLRYTGNRWDTLATGLLAASPVSPTLAYGLDTLGNLVRSTNGGRAWSAVPAAPPRKYPAPWYYAAVALTVAGTLGATRVRQRADLGASERSIADILVSDRPLREGDRDVLDFGKIAAGLSRFIRNTRTEPPLTIAITGPWGTGKSSLMNLLRRDLERRRFRTIWFNAWHHQREESLLASLLEVIRRTATPPVWSWKGMRFRARLLGKRFHRYRAALVLLPVFAFAVGYILKDPHSRWHDFDAGVQSIFRVFTGDDRAKTAAPPEAAGDAHPITAPERTALALVISIVGTILTYAKGLKAFGVKPGDVAKSVATAGRVRTIESQPAFRYRFAQDFGEVTQALKPERIVIFVDDLDRCKPEQVLEILEAINFLAESGDCVVVLGIDRERVTGCVAIGFKDVATVLAQASTTGTPVAKPDIGAAAPPPKTNLDYQLDYARHYLEKLLNMEVPIPPATPEGLGKVMTDSGAPTLAPDEPAPDAVEESMEGARRRRRNRIYATALAVLTVVFFLRGFTGEITPVRSPDAARASAQAAADVAARDTTSVQTAVPDRSTMATTSPLRREPVLLVAGITPTTAWWWHVPLALAAMALLLWLVTPREDPAVEDSAAFATALRAWAPVLFEEHPTPRS